MAIETTPNGTYGPTMPNIPHLLRPIIFGLVTLSVKLKGGRILKLTTTGAKTGKEHTIPLSWFEDGEDAWLIVGSNGGALKHPAWYFNIAKNPDKVWIEVNGQKHHVQAEALKGAEYEKVWNRVVDKAPGYAEYRKKTDRHIAILRLTPHS